MLGKDGKFRHGIAVAAAMTAQHHTQFFRHSTASSLPTLPAAAMRKREEAASKPALLAPPALAPNWVGRTGDVFQFPQSERCTAPTLRDRRARHKRRLLSPDRYRLRPRGGDRCPPPSAPS